MTSKPKRRPASALADLRERIRGEGAEVAFQALMQVCRDPKAPAQAKATAGSTIFRSAGLMEKAEDDIDDIEPGEATWDQLQRMIARGAEAVGAPDDLVDAAADAGSDRTEAEPSVEAPPARRQRRTAAAPGETIAPFGSPLDDFG